MADRYRGRYYPYSYYERDPQDDYDMYGPRGPSLPSYYPPHAPVIPGDYSARHPALPDDYTPRAPILSREYGARHRTLPDDYTPRDPILSREYGARPPTLPDNYTPRAPILSREYGARPPTLPDDYTSRDPFLPGGHDIIRHEHDSRPYGLDGPAGVANTALPGMSGLPAGARARGPSPLEDPPLAGRSGLAPPLAQAEDPALIRRSSSLGKSAGVPDVEHHSPLLDHVGPLEGESNILFVDGLPSDCTRREVAHLFRPFVGFKDIRLVHKEPRRSGDKGYVLCFVEFEDAKYAFAAMEALQAYCLDDRKPDGPVLKIQFARFPFRLPGAEVDKRRSRSAAMR